MFSRLLRPGKRSLESLSEQEVLALAISSEEDDGRMRENARDRLMRDSGQARDIEDRRRLGPLFLRHAPSQSRRAGAG